MGTEGTHRRGRRARRGGGAEERRKEGNTTQGHKGTKDTKFRKDRTKVQNRGMANPLLFRSEHRTHLLSPITAPQVLLISPIEALGFLL